MKVKTSDVYYGIYIVLGIVCILISIFTDKSVVDIILKLLLSIIYLLSLFGYIIISSQEKEIKRLEQNITELEIRNKFKQQIIEIYETPK